MTHCIEDECSRRVAKITWVKIQDRELPRLNNRCAKCRAKAEASAK